MITITNIARQQIKGLIKNDGGKAAYLYLKSGGCNGFNHIFSIAIITALNSWKN